MLREDGEQMHDGLVLFRADNAGLEVSFLEFAQVHFPAPVGEELDGFGELRLAGFLEENLAGLKKAKQQYSKSHIMEPLVVLYNAKYKDSQSCQK